jgi:hypothetical protein
MAMSKYNQVLGTVVVSDGKDADFVEEGRWNHGVPGLDMTESGRSRRARSDQNDHEKPLDKSMIF